MISRLNHVGLSVMDLERSIRFYCNLIRGELVVQSSFGGSQYDTILALPGSSGRVAVIRGSGIQLELFEFSQPTPARKDPQEPVSNHGITHFCIEIVDLDAEYQRLVSEGVTFHCPPLLFFGTAKATYGRDPDGNAFELLELLKQDNEQSMDRQ